MRSPFSDGLLLLVSVVAVCLGGCGGDTTQQQAEIAQVEPADIDAPDESARDRFRQALQGQSPGKDATDWPQLFGPHRTSRVSTTINPVWDGSGPKELWSREVGTGYGSPVVSSGRVIFNHREGDEEIIQCVDAETGGSVWDHRYPTTFQCDYEYSDGPYSTPLVSGDAVYVFGGQGQLVCLELATGDTKWSRELYQEYELEDDIFAAGCSPGVVGDRLIVNVGAGNQAAGIVALDLKTGETVWESTDHGAAYCSPFAASIHGQAFLFVVTNLGLVCLHPETGQVDWTIEHRGRAPMSFNSVSPLVHQDKVLIVTGPGPGALCLRVLPDRSYEVAWKDRRVIDCQFNSLLLAGDDLYGFTAAGQGGAEFRCIDFNTGELKWKYHSLLRRGQGLIAGDAIILLGERGHLASLLLDNQSPQVLAFTDEPLMTEPCYCAPAYADGRLYLKDERRIACFDLRP